MSLKNKRDIYLSLGAELQALGGILRCTVCGRETGLGDIAERLEFGWPKHCRLTMLWVTQRLLDEETISSGEYE